VLVGDQEELKSRVVEFVSDVLEFPFAQFQDPDGNTLQLRVGR
jgi:hypothetical protein